MYKSIKGDIKLRPKNFAFCYVVLHIFFYTLLSPFKNYPYKIFFVRFFPYKPRLIYLIFYFMCFTILHGKSNSLYFLYMFPSKNRHKMMEK